MSGMEAAGVGTAGADGALCRYLAGTCLLRFGLATSPALPPDFLWGIVVHLQHAELAGRRRVGGMRMRTVCKYHTTH